MAINKRDCIECADQHLVADMYPHEGGFICDDCFTDTFELVEGEYDEAESNSMNKEQLLKELLERRQFWEYELENLEKLELKTDRELKGAIAGIDVAIQLVNQLGEK